MKKRIKTCLIDIFFLERLNEGFASWVQYLGYDKTHPEWRDVRV